MYGLTPFGRNRYDIFDLFNDFDNSFFGNSSSGSLCRTDIRDDGEKYVMETELPGFNRDDINIDISGSTLVIAAERHCSNDEKDANGSYIRRERVCGSYKRSFDISDVDGDGINAEYKNGILSIDLPKKKHEKPETKRLEIK